MPHVNSDRNGRSVLVFSQVPPPVHGSTMVTKALIEELHATGYTVELLDRRFSRAVAEVGRVSARKVLAVFGLFLRAYRQLRRRPDILIFFGTNRLGSYAIDLVVMFIARVFKVPTVQYIHTVGFNRLALIPGSRRTIGWFLRCEAVVCLSEWVAKDVEAVVPDANIEIIPNALRDLRCDTGVTSEALFVFLANLIPEKGAIDFAAVARRIQQSFPACQFIIRGFPGAEPYMRELGSEIASISNLRYDGPITDVAEKAALLSSATALIYPSSYPFEAQPMAIIEAMSVGTPTIAYGVGGIPDIIDEEVNGWICEDVEEITQRVRNLVTNPKGASAVRVTTRETFAARHTIDVFAASWIGVIERYARSR